MEERWRGASQATAAEEAEVAMGVLAEVWLHLQYPAGYNLIISASGAGAGGSGGAGGAGGLGVVAWRKWWETADRALPVLER